MNEYHKSEVEFHRKHRASFVNRMICLLLYLFFGDNGHIFAYPPFVELGEFGKSGYHFILRCSRCGCVDVDDGLLRFRDTASFLEILYREKVWNKLVGSAYRCENAWDIRVKKGKMLMTLYDGEKDKWRQSSVCL